MNPTTKAAKQAKTKTGKPKAPARKAPQEVARAPKALRAFCDCIAGNFRSVPWGTPVLKLVISQGFTILTIRVPVKFQFTCRKTSPEERCLAVLTPHLVKMDFGIRTVASAGTGGTPFHGGVCNGKPTFEDSTARFVIVLREEHRKFDGRLDLRFTLELCTGVRPWDMTLVIRDGKLDENASDYDGDGTPNDEEGRGLEWNPDR